MRITIVLAALCAALVAVAPRAPAATPDLAQEIEEAVALLLASVRAQTHAWEDFERQVKAGALSPGERRDYEIYLDQLARMVEDNRARLVALSHEINAGAAAPAPAAVQGEPPPTSEERVAALDAELGASLSEFDELLLDEMERVRRQSDTPTEARTEGAPGADGTPGGESARRGGEESAAPGGTDTGTDPAGEGDAESAAGRAGDDDTRTEPGAPGEAKPGDGGRVADAGASTGAGTGGGAPDDTADDDDVVARQLREAAERETDPALKERLWEEYRRYKSGARASAGERR